MTANSPTDLQRRSPRQLTLLGLLAISLSWFISAQPAEASWNHWGSEPPVPPQAGGGNR